MGANSTGTPTTLGIPTLNNAQDILKGDGINEIVTSIDSKIAARMFAPSGPTDKQVVKWSTSGGAWIADFVDPAELKQSGATNGQGLVWNSGTGKWVPGSLAGAELGYVQSTSPVTAPNASLATVVTFPSIAFDGAPVMVEFFAPFIEVQDAVINSYQISLYEGATAIGTLNEGSNEVASTNFAVSCIGSFRFTPTAGSHTYKIQAIGGAGRWILFASTAGVNAVSLYGRITKV